MPAGLNSECVPIMGFMNQPLPPRTFEKIHRTSKYIEAYGIFEKQHPDCGIWVSR